MSRYNKYCIVTLVLLTASFLLAASNGKIAGRVTDENGAPLIGTNIIVSGTGLGAATDINGTYFILNVPAGKYTLTFSMIGYRTLVQEEVLAVSDLTTTINAVLSESVLEAEEVTVIAERPMIRRDVTSSMVIITGDEIINMPVSDFRDILATQTGYTTDADGDLHVRGGRSKEILYIIDGIVVKDPLGGDFTGAVAQNTIQELTVISGTFNAEYGEAMSSVVNIVTREGGDHFSGQIEYFSGYLGESIYHQQDAFDGILDTNYVYIDVIPELLSYYAGWSTGDNSPAARFPLLDLGLTGTGNLTLSGPVAKTGMNYFFSGFYRSEPSHLPHGGNVEQDMQLKLTSHPVSGLKITAQLQSTSRLYQLYSHAWKFLPLNNSYTYRGTDRYSVGITHSLSSSSYHSATLWYLKSGRFTRAGDIELVDYKKPEYSSDGYFRNSGNSGVFSNDRTITRGAKWDIVHQLNFENQIRAGISFKQQELNILTIDEPWENGINFVDDTTFTPVEAAIYIQDKIEYDYIILNIGLRYDYLDPKAAMWRDIGVFGERDPDTGEWEPAALLTVAAKDKLSPRLGISLPVTERTIFHFSYGHFFQFPNFDAMTYNANQDISAALPVVGNPRVNAQKTVAFETGLKHSLSDNAALMVTAWTKDITDLLSTVQLRYLSKKYVVYTNTDYASVKGLDIEYRLRRWGPWSGSLGYSLSMAKGNNSDPLGGYFSAYTLEEVPHQEYYLDFDQRHDFALNVSFHTGPSTGGIARLVENTVANLLITSGSGLPYTPYVDPTFRVPVNSARKPWTFSADVRLRRRFDLDIVQLEALLEITNLTDYQNVYRVFSRTGKPFDPGYSGALANEDSNHNPANIGAPRMVKVGFNVRF